jgi:tRNA threonylcarbamoyladenosine biosynthesis protein TsaB
VSQVPLLLAIETATTAAAGVALMRGDAVLVSRALPSERPASETLLPAVLEVLEEAGVALAAIEAFAVSVGPGSFTGLRVGVATVKGLAFGGEALVVPVPTLAALALRAAPAPGPIAALLDARRGEVYAAIYDGDPGLQPRVGPAVLRPEALAEVVATLAAELPCTVIGEGVAVVADALRARFGDALRLVPPPAGLPDAVAVGRLGARLLAAGAGIAAEALTPVYVRRAEAEVQRTGERFEASRKRFDTPGNVS